MPAESCLVNSESIADALNPANNGGESVALGVNFPLKLFSRLFSLELCSQIEISCEKVVQSHKNVGQVFKADEDKLLLKLSRSYFKVLRLAVRLKYFRKL